MVAGGLNSIDNPILYSTGQTMSLIRQARAQAVAKTSAYTVSALSPQEIVVSYAEKCSDENRITAHRLALKLPTEVALTDIHWSVCFNSRGLADDNLTIDLIDLEENQMSVEVLLGGAVRVDGR